MPRGAAVRSKQGRRVGALGRRLAQGGHLVIVTVVVIVILTCRDRAELGAW